MKRVCKSQREKVLSDVRNYRHNNENSMLEGSCAGLHEWVQLSYGADINNMSEDKDKPVVMKHIINPKRLHVFVTENTYDVTYDT